MGGLILNAKSSIKPERKSIQHENMYGWAVYQVCLDCRAEACALANIAANKEIG